MVFWKKLLSSRKRKPVDYYQEAKELFDDKKFHDALTSFRLALKEAPGDPLVLQEIAMCYTRVGMNEEAVQPYQHVLQKTPGAAGAPPGGRGGQGGRGGEARSPPLMTLLLQTDLT